MGSGHKSHTTDARYLLGPRWEPGDQEDQQEFLRANHQRFADESDLIPEQPLWSGLKDGGVLDLTPRARSCCGREIRTATLLWMWLCSGSSEVIEDRPALRVPVTRDLNVERFPSHDGEACAV